jgi:alkanesulfonate monooxygenase SsuD/methylene tetrahydromethanopterin reductase-like flavin-dependent oxidoreductase (luciferase family)
LVPNVIGSAIVHGGLQTPYLSILDLAAIGSERSVVRQLRRYLDAGAMDVVISPLDRSETLDREQLWGLVASL